MSEMKKHVEGMLALYTKAQEALDIIDQGNKAAKTLKKLESEISTLDDKAAEKRSEYEALTIQTSDLKAEAAEILEQANATKATLIAEGNAEKKMAMDTADEYKKSIIEDTAEGKKELDRLNGEIAEAQKVLNEAEKKKRKLAAELTG